MRLVFIAAMLATLAVPDVAASQDTPRQTRQGFTGAFGLGSGSVAITCDGCDVDREPSIGMRLFLGGTLKPNLVLGGEIQGWSKEGTGGTVTLVWINFVAQWYPEVTRGFFVKGGLGLSGISSDARIGNASAKLETNGFGLVAGTGYDIRLGRNFSLTPYVDYLFASKADARVNGGSTDARLGGNMLHLGIAATWH